MKKENCMYDSELLKIMDIHGKTYSKSKDKRQPENIQLKSLTKDYQGPLQMIRKRSIIQ